jgi:hypothetical protein
MVFVILPVPRFFEMDEISFSVRVPGSASMRLVTEPYCSSLNLAFPRSNTSINGTEHV